MKRIIGYTDSVQECECCGKTELKGTYCLEIDGVELYYGSVCAFKVHGVSDDEKKEAVTKFKKEVKKKQNFTTLEEMAASATNTFLQSKVIAFIAKKNLDLRSFIEKNGTLIEETKFYFAYTYGGLAKVHIFDK